VLLAEPIIQCADLNGAGGLSEFGERVVGENPLLDVTGQGVELACPVLAAILMALPAQVVTHGSLTNAEGQRDLGGGLAHELECLDLVSACHALLPKNLACTERNCGQSKGVPFAPEAPRSPR
jgi:hypothetical protein